MQKQIYCQKCGRELDWYGEPNGNEYGYCLEHGRVAENVCEEVTEE